MATGEFAKLDFLQAQQKKAITENRASFAHRTKLCDEYGRLIERLKTQADQISSLTMVPIGSVGFFPGKLIHTNEVTVLLGDNWFADRSTKQATEMGKRRLKLIDDQLEALNREYENMNQHKQFTEEVKGVKDELHDVKEIVEELPEFSPNKGKRRIAHAPKHNVFPRSVKPKDDSKINHNELVARLSELKVEPQESSTSRKRHVQFETADDQDVGCLDDDFVSSSPPQPIFTSPADIYESYISASRGDQEERPLKSILKKDSRSNSNENLKLKPILKNSPEHRPNTPEHVLDDPKPILKTPPDTQSSEYRPGTPEFMLSDEPRPILKTHTDPLCTDEIVDLHDETRSILKISRDSPVSMLQTDDHHRSILKMENVEEISMEPKPILKSPTVAMGLVVERDTTQSSTNKQAPAKGGKISRFKAARLKK